MSVITIDTSSLAKGAKDLNKFIKVMDDIIDDVLNTNMIEMEAAAKRNAPGDRGFLRQNISAKTSVHLKKELTVNAFYAAYIEFGTGVYAAQYVATLPADWQAFARQFKGEKKPSIKAILFFLAEWFRRHGITDKQHAYNIARKVFIYGIRPRHYLRDAFVMQEKQILDDIKAAINAIST